MRLAVFDIDGTLTLGEGLGTRCFFDAVEAVFGPGDVDRRLDAYTESTDGGIAREAVARLQRREAAAHEVEQLKLEYFDRLEAAIAGRRGAYRPVPGAERVLPLLEARHGWTVAIATGNWRRAAALKLACAAISEPAVLAGSEDGHSRAEVLAAAIRRAAGAAGVEAFDGVVYVGDQPWDLEAARRVGAGFVGIGASPRDRGLRQAGARVLDGFLEAAEVLAAVEEAAACPAVRPWPGRS